MATREDILRKLDISSNDWVLEIGGGPNPFIRSDVLADKSLADDTERSGSVILDRPTIICDAHNLPFVDDSFGYVFCSQILEHLESPEIFFKEIARVGRKGYIETPNEIRERLFGWPFHEWIVNKDKNGLVLRENDVEQAFGLFFHELQLENYEFARFCSICFDLLNISYEWDGSPSFRFAEKDECTLPAEKVYIPAKEVSKFIMSEPHNKRLSERFSFLKEIKKRIPKTVKQSLKRTIHSSPYGYRHSDRDTRAYLKEILACPECKVKVYFEKDKMSCLKCDKHFKVENGIPFMLVE